LSSTVRCKGGRLKAHPHETMMQAKTMQRVAEVLLRNCPDPGFRPGDGEKSILSHVLT
jgi:hypothetical protein